MTNLFTKKSLEQGWAPRISALLDVPMSQYDHMPLFQVHHQGCSTGKGIDGFSQVEEISCEYHATHDAEIS